MNASILSIGDELVLGQTVDTNSAWISQRLSTFGLDTKSHRTVADDQAAIERAIAEMAQDADLLIVSGGIGPTEDDLTRQALAAVMNAELLPSEIWLAKLDEFFKGRGRRMPPINRIQAMIPAGAELVDNPAGTAAGIRAKIGRCDVFVVPGVPKEMKAIFAATIEPFAKSLGGGAAIVQTKLNTFGLGESAIAEKLGELMTRGRNPSVGTTVSGGIVSCRINGRFDSPDRAAAEVAATAALCRERLGDVIYSVDDESLAEVVARLLIEKKAFVATAESCTGGLLAKMLTDVPGSSAYFHSGFVTYSNRAKYERLGVSENILHAHGAVSEPVVLAMATGARRLAKADIALAISGIAGPGGGTEVKPVGTVCIALTVGPRTKFNPDLETSVASTYNFPGDREMIRDRSAKMALSMLRSHLLQTSPSSL